MSRTKESTKKSAGKGVMMTLRLDDALNESLEAAVVRTKLSKSDLARLSFERGLEIVVRQLTTKLPEMAA